MTKRMLVAIDPGESVGVVYQLKKEDWQAPGGFTFTGNDRLKSLWNLLQILKPDIVIFEQFALRQGVANKLIGNKFITCEVIGIIKLYCAINHVEIIELLPSAKEYCGFSSNPKDERYKIIEMGTQKITEHTRDAFRLLSYAKLFKIDKEKL